MKIAQSFPPNDGQKYDQEASNESQEDQAAVVHVRKYGKRSLKRSTMETDLTEFAIPLVIVQGAL